MLPMYRITTLLNPMLKKPIFFRAFANDTEATEIFAFNPMDTKFDWDYGSNDAEPGSCYCDQCFHSHPHCHHSFNSSDEDQVEANPFIVPFVSCRMTRFSSFAVLQESEGSKLYSVGCYETPSAVDSQELDVIDNVRKPKNQVFSLNLNSFNEANNNEEHQPCWSAGSKMLSCRKAPHVLVLDRQLFVIGGVDPTQDDQEEYLLSKKYNPDRELRRTSSVERPEVIRRRLSSLTIRKAQAEYQPHYVRSQLPPRGLMKRNFYQKSESLFPIPDRRLLRRKSMVDEATLGLPRFSSRYSHPDSSPEIQYLEPIDVNRLYVLSRLELLDMVKSKLEPLMASSWTAMISPSKLYQKQPWAEFYNPKTCVWKCLPEPPSRLTEGYGSGFICAAIEDDQVIMVGSAKDNVLYSYSLKTGLWTTLNGHKLDSSCSGKAVVVHRTLYWFTTRGYLMAYDLDKKIWHQGILDKNWDDRILGTYSFHPGLVHLESNLFGLLWANTRASYTGGSLAQQSHLHCLKFHVSTTDQVDHGGRGLLNISIKSCHSRPIDHGITFVDCAF